MAYNFNHVISLIFFNNIVETKCEFTELFMEFKDLVKSAQTGIKLFKSKK
jgi:hypothetical protein